MSLTHAAGNNDTSYTFSSDLHSVVRPSAWEAPSVITRYPGLVGLSERTDELKGRTLSVEYTVDGLGDEADLAAGLRAWDDLINKLTGDLTVNPPGGSSTTYQRCTFKGYLERERFVDGATGQWVWIGILRWLQRSPND